MAVAKKKKTAPKRKTRYSATEEFKSASAYMKGGDIEKHRRKLRGAQMKITKMERVEFEKDDGGTDILWLMHTDGEFDLPYRVNLSNGRALAEDLGDDIGAWVGNTVSITANKTSMGFGVIIEAVDGIDEDVEEDVEEDVPFGNDDDEDIE